MAARRAHETPRRVGLQPALVLAPVPDAILGAEHPPTAFAVEHRQVADRNPVRARLQIARATFFGQILVTNLGFGERIYCHRGDYASPGRVGSGAV